MRKLNAGMMALAVCMLAGCGSAASDTAEASTQPTMPTVYASPIAVTDAEYADMSGYKTYSDTTEYHFIKTTLDHVQEMREDGASFVFFMGYDECVYCNAAMPIINAEAEKYNMDIYYVNAIDAVNDGSMGTHRDEFVDQFKDQLTLESDGSYSIQVPLVAFYEDGQLELFHIGFVDDFDPEAGNATDSESAEYLAIVDPGFKVVAEGKEQK